MENSLNKDNLRITPTSIKGRNAINTGINAESFEYGYFLETEIVFVVHFLKLDARILAFRTER